MRTELLHVLNPDETAFNIETGFKIDCDPHAVQISRRYLCRS